MTPPDGHACHPHRRQLVPAPWRTAGWLQDFGGHAKKRGRGRRDEPRLRSTATAERSPPALRLRDAPPGGGARLRRHAAPSGGGARLRCAALRLGLAGIGRGAARRDVLAPGPTAPARFAAAGCGWGGLVWPHCPLESPGQDPGHRHHEDLDLGARLRTS
ncbi:PRELI domain containing protein 3B isoform X3 [Marmota flaviventris]|uniref:PRELI domain containing protein 3B isoform X3 n=1 Tax=Marmota flaviventris TaxID=93162 RepID=UPI003A890184